MTDMTRRQMLLSSAGAGLTLAATSVAALPSLRISDLNAEEEGITDLARELADTRIDTYGFMTPPLSHRAPFFVMAQQPMGTCPVCDNIEDYPYNIITVLMTRSFMPVPFSMMIEVSGVLRLGEHFDLETGFASPIRLEDVSFKVARG